MTRRLLLMRHAKSTPAKPGMSDHERPLEEKGVDDASAAGKKLHKHGYEPDVVLCSDSTRTLETWAQIKERFDKDTSFIKSAKLYEASVSAYRNAIISKGKNAKTILLIGHNPTIEQFVATFSKEPAEVKPADTVILEIKATDWEEAFDMAGTWKLAEIIRC